ncbi:hypothetical protein HY36_12160 [Hyphomonas atlantica]|uniref:Uncharacterized protein n=1 Tax=Hyphomonas atlantica TaxID=1280948 RepID=A0A059DX75_9PROT|nr:hypothetical protein HY36_12160 [Hyphomonas atlantica]
MVTWGGAQEAADGGIDVSVKDAGKLLKPNFVPRSTTGYQVKKHSMGKSACTKEMQSKGKVKQVIENIANQHGAYIIVSGKDDCSEKMLADRLTGMKAAIDALANKKNLKLDFYGRDRIITWLRSHPGVSLWARHRLGKPLSGWRPFERWAATPAELEDEFLVDDHPCVLFANLASKASQPLLDGIKLARDRLKPAGSAVRITGLSGVGKTRFAQALFEEGVGEGHLPSSNAIYADLGDDLTPSASELVAHLIANDSSAYLVLDNCPPDVHRLLQKKVAASGTKLRLLTIEYDISDDKPEETEVIHLEPSSEQTVSKLVQKRFPGLGRVNADKIAEFSGGNARVAIALSSRVDADETLSKFSDEELFNRLFSQRKGPSESLLESAEVLSLVYSFNVSPDEYNDELSALGRISGLDRRTLHRDQAELLRRQLSQQRGDWRAVLPHALANRVAKRALENLPLDDINAELFKQCNVRLFKSCAHRIGYLHDFQPARNLADSWVASGAPLHDIASCDAELLTCLDYIAPVFPETVLTALETATKTAGFASRSNPHFNLFVRLLCHLAYEDDQFDRAIEVLLRFAETEEKGENNNSIVGQMKHLFSLYLSGTEASPLRRQEFVAKLLKSPIPRHHEIASDLLHAALEVSHWSSFATFGFGARKRGSGWQPKTRQERIDWYVGFVGLLQRSLESNKLHEAKWAKEMLAPNFRSLWTLAGCFDVLEEIVRAHAEGGAWPEIWMSIKSTLYFDGEKHEASLLERLKELEKVSAPNDPYSEIEAYALSNTWDHAELKDGIFSESQKKLGDKIISLGELACADPKYLEQMGERLWGRHFDALWYFGKGVARGSSKRGETFEFLVGQLEKSQLDQIYPVLLQGYIHEVHDGDANQARQLQERILEVPKLKAHFVNLLSSVPIAPWGAKKLIDLAKAGELAAWQYTHISLGRKHEAITDDDLSELLSALLEADGGVAVVFQILEMRFFIDQNSDYVPTEVLLAVGRKAITKMAAMRRDEIGQFRSLGFGRVADRCLIASAPSDEVTVIVKLLCDGIQNYRLYGFEMGECLSPLIKNFPELVLDRVFSHGDRDDNEDLLSHSLFRDLSYESRGAQLNDASVDRLIAWCKGDQTLLGKIAKSVRTYSTAEAGEGPSSNPKRVVLSDHIMALLNVVEDKSSVVDIIAANTWPSGWSGSLADILERRAEAFAALMEHSSEEVCQLAKTKLRIIEQSIRINRAQEIEQSSRREQRFE